MAKPLPVWATLLLLAALAFADGARAAAPAQYEHDAAGRRVALKLPNGGKTTYAHDAAGRLTKVESKNAAGNVISAFGYALDATGNRTAMDVTLNGTVNHIAYEFDNAYRLTRETRKDAAGQTLYDEGLTYDPVGNRLTRNWTQIAAVNGAPQSVTENTVYAYNNANQLLTETTNGVTTAYGYDKNGNNTTISTPAANGNPAKNIAMTYDWLNRQTRWSDGTRTESTVFAGADWKRASTTVTMGANGAAAAPSIVKYLYDGDNVLADYDANNALTAFYVTPGLDQNLSVTDASGATSYYTQDGLGSVRLLTSTNGTILNRYDYTAFGETFAPNTSATTPNRYTYTAREQSPLAAHGAPMYYRWRNYAPEVGRFGWRDPIGYEDGVNVYGYVDGMPYIATDIFGLVKSFIFATRHENPDIRDANPNEILRERTVAYTVLVVKNVDCGCGCLRKIAMECDVELGFAIFILPDSHQEWNRWMQRDARRRSMPNYNGEQMIAAAQRGDKAAYRKAIIEHEKQHLRDFWSKRGEFLSEVKQYEKNMMDTLSAGRTGLIIGNGILISFFLISIAKSAIGHNV